MKYLSDGSVFKKHLKFLSRHTGYSQFLQCSSFYLSCNVLTFVFFRHLKNFPLKLKRLRRATTLLDMQLGYQKSMDSARIAQMACTHHPLIATVYTKHLIQSYKPACVSGIIFVRGCQRSMASRMVMILPRNLWAISLSFDL